jgi:protein-L-isoaspartate(D-aspartate) O-methyltransferase
MSSASSASARQNMLKSQLITGHVLNQNVLDALLAVPREAFVPAPFQGVAYIDEEVSIGHNRYLMEPLAFARMLEQASITSQHTVMDIGCGSGYSSAVLAHLAQRVVAVEEQAALATLAKKNLGALSNVTCVQSPLVDGMQKHAPYDIILIQGAIEFVPQALADQLKEGGKMLVFERDAQKHIGTSGLNNLVEYKKIHTILYRTAICAASVATLTQFDKPDGFSF